MAGTCITSLTAEVKTDGKDGGDVGDAKTDDIVHSRRLVDKVFKVLSLRPYVTLHVPGSPLLLNDHSPSNFKNVMLYMQLPNMVKLYGKQDGLVRDEYRTIIMAVRDGAPGRAALALPASTSRPHVDDRRFAAAGNSKSWLIVGASSRQEALFEINALEPRKVNSGF